MEEEPNGSAVEKMKFSRDGSKLAVARLSGQIEMWTVSNGECQWKTKSNRDANYRRHLAFSADDSKLACERRFRKKTKNRYKTIVLDAESGKKCKSEDTFDFKSSNDHVHRVDDVS